MSELAYFMIDGGRTLELVTQYVKDVRRVRNESICLSKELGAERFMISSESGVVTYIDFGDKARHPDFKVPEKHRGSRPKRGTEWAKRFAAQVGHESDAALLLREFKIPLSVTYGKTTLTGWRALGYPGRECGFLYPGEKGPFGMFVIDVPAEVAAMKKEGYKVGQPAASFKMEFDGARRIHKEEWDIVVAQHTLKKKGKPK